MPPRLRVLLTLLALLATLQFSQAVVDTLPEDLLRLMDPAELDNATEAVPSAEEPNEAVLAADEPASPIMHESDEPTEPILVPPEPAESDEPTEPILVPPEPAEPDELPDSDPPATARPKPTPGPRTAAHRPRDPPVTTLPDCGTPERPCLSRVRQ
jgi:hypothetical protein